MNIRIEQDEKYYLIYDGEEFLFKISKATNSLKDVLKGLGL